MNSSCSRLQSLVGEPGAANGRNHQSHTLCSNALDCDDDQRHLWKQFQHAINLLHPRLPSILPALLPGGRFQGNEYLCGSITGGPGSTCITNQLTGVGADSTTGQRWADIIELASQIWELPAFAAANKLLSEFGASSDPSHSTEKLISPVPQLVAVDVTEFLEMELPERGYILHPVIPAQGIVEAYAPRGVGKTFVALSMALAVSSGTSVFGWKAPKPRRVLYIDGEMSARGMQERLRALINGSADITGPPNLFTLITPDLQSIAMPDLSTENGQAAVEPLLHNVSLVILDNLATLCRTGKENESGSWLPVQGWLLNLRRRGTSTLVIHHAGKNGDQRGTSAKEDVMDTVIGLRRPAEYSMSEGARFEVHLTKARGIVGEDAKPFEAHLKTDGEQSFWETRPIDDVELETLKVCLEAKMTIREIAEEMGKSKSTIHRMKQKLKY